MHNANNFIRLDIRALTSSLFDNWFCVYLLIWSCVILLRVFEIYLYVVNDWLTDFIFVPITAHLALTLARMVHPKLPQLKFPLYYIMVVSVLSALVFEYLAPKFSIQYTADFFDVLSYLAGGFFYYYVHQAAVVRKMYKS